MVGQGRDGVFFAISKLKQKQVFFSKLSVSCIFVARFLTTLNNQQTDGSTDSERKRREDAFDELKDIEMYQKKKR